MRRLLIVLSLVLATAASAQQLPKLTWVRYYDLASEPPRAAFYKLLAEKKILGWGILAPMTRIGDPFSHIVHVSVANWDAVDDVAAAFEATGRAEGSHDVMLRHVVQSDTPPKAKPRYVVINEHPVIRGRDSDAIALFNEWAKPVFLEVGAKGKLGPWGMFVQDTVIDNTWTYAVWYFVSDLSALDEVHASLMNMGLPRLGTYERRLREMSEDDYRGQVLRVVHHAP